MPTLVIKNTSDGSEQEQEVAESLSIGRGDGNDLVLSEGGVSRKHARFFVEEGSLVVEDVGSQNGTWVDGERIEAPVALSAKNQVVIGDYEISLKVGSKSRPAAKSGKPSTKSTTPAGHALPQKPNSNGNGARSTKVVAAMKGTSGAAISRRPKPSGNATGPTLRGLTGTVTGKSFPLSGTVLVGRVSGVDIQIDDDSVSRRHAELEVSGRSVVLRDLGSANGTTVNGAPVSEDTPLSSGDIVQFGVVEVMFESGATSGSRSPAVRRGSERPERPGRPSRRGAAEDPEEAVPTDMAKGGMDPRKKRLIIIAGAVVGLLFVLVLAKAMITPGPKLDPGAGKNPGKKPPPKPVDPQEQIESLLAAARSYSATDMGNEPNWPRAEEAVQRVLEIEPIHVEANQLLKKIQVERSCQENLKKATELASSNRMEESLDFYSKVKPDCPTYFLKVLTLAKEPVEETKKLAGAECKTYASNGKWEEALKRCEVYAKLACQTTKVEELYPPAMTTMKLDGPVGKNDWRPKDTLYVNFLRARLKLKPRDPLWQCPDFPAFRPPPPPPDPAKQAKEEFMKRYPESEMGFALVLYFEGKTNEAPVPLQKIRENVYKAALHEAAKALQLDINNVINYYQNGLTELTNNKPERAEEPFRKALALDEKLVLGDKVGLPEAERKKELDKRVSFIRKTIVESMASNCYQKGKELADRKDFRAACKIWKVGFSFSRANNDLLKAVQFCSGKAGKAFDSSNSCELYKSVLDYAVDGDGYREQVQDKMVELGCN